MYALTRITLTVLYVVTLILRNYYESRTLKAFERKLPFEQEYKNNPTNLTAAVNAFKLQEQENRYNQKFDTWHSRNEKLKSLLNYRNNMLAYSLGTTDTYLFLEFIRPLI